MVDFVGLLVPLGAMGFIFGVFWLVTNFLVERARLGVDGADGAGGAGAHQAAIEEALDGQRALAAETKALASRVEQIERLLQEV